MLFKFASKSSRAANKSSISVKTYTSLFFRFSALYGTVTNSNYFHLISSSLNDASSTASYVAYVDTS